MDLREPESSTPRGFGLAWLRPRQDRPPSDEGSRDGSKGGHRSNLHIATDKLVDPRTFGWDNDNTAVCPRAAYANNS